MIAYCGMDCSKCEGYLATQENDNSKRAEVAEKWSVQYNADINPEQINCNGCKSDGIKFFFTESMCEIRKCNIEKSNPHCAACSEYKCEKLEKFIEIAHQLGRHLRHYAKNKIVRKQLVGNQDPIEQIPKKLENQAIALTMQLTRPANSAASPSLCFLGPVMPSVRAACGGAGLSSFPAIEDF